MSLFRTRCPRAAWEDVLGWPASPRRVPRPWGDRALVRGGARPAMSVGWQGVASEKGGVTVFWPLVAIWRAKRVRCWQSMASVDVCLEKRADNGAMQARVSSDRASGPRGMGP